MAADSKKVAFPQGTTSPFGCIGSARARWAEGRDATDRRRIPRYNDLDGAALLWQDDCPSDFIGGRSRWIGSANGCITPQSYRRFHWGAIVLTKYTMAFGTAAKRLRPSRLAAAGRRQAGWRIPPFTASKANLVPLERPFEVVPDERRQGFLAVLHAIHRHPLRCAHQGLQIRRRNAP